MPKIEYVSKKFQAKSQERIDQIIEIVREFEDDGYDLTSRQIYYQLVARGFVENSQASYKRVASLIADSRMAGLLDWYSIVDRTRHIRGLNHWESPHSIIRGAARSYREQKWSDQPVRLEVFIEKDALIGVIEGVCNELDVDYFSCRGYSSASEMWRAAQRFIAYNDNGQRVVIVHLGDHDPSGIDMTRDIRDRLAVFGADVEVRRVALTWEQVQQYQPPPNPAKMTDSRATDYVAQFGNESWELDALAPALIGDLIRNEVEAERDDVLWAAALVVEQERKDLLADAAERWDDVVDFLGGE